MTIADYARQFPNEVVGAVRGAMIATAIVGIVIGFCALFWTKQTLTVVGVLFGISLVFAGLFRLWQAFAASFLSVGWRIVLAAIGVIILAVGIVCLASPHDISIWFFGIFIGVGWVFQGVGDLYAAATGSLHAPRWYLILAGVISVLAGIVMMILPAAGTTVLLKVGGIILIVISVVTLLTLPKKLDDDPALTV